MVEPPTIHIVLLVLDLHIPGAQSLKSKRRVLKSLKERLRAKFNVSVAEVGEQDKWQRAVCGLVMLGNDNRMLDASINAVLAFTESFREVTVVDSRIEFL